MGVSINCISRLFGCGRQYSPGDRPIGERAVKGYANRHGAAGSDAPGDIFIRPPLRPNRHHVGKKFAGDGSNQATWRITAQTRDALQRYAESASRSAEQKVALANKTIRDNVAQLISSAGDLLRAAVQQDTKQINKEVVVSLFDAYDAADMPSRALSVKVSEPAFFEMVGDRAYARYLATQEASGKGSSNGASTDAKRYYDIAGQAWQKAATLRRAAPAPSSPTPMKATPPPTAIPSSTW